jgi:2'-5' RNA ligase
LFVAIDPPDPVRTVLAEIPQTLGGVTWTPPGQYHLTLRFIGEVAEERLARIESALAGVRVERFLIGLEGVGTFPPAPRPPKIIWAGIGSAHPRLFQLRQKVDDALLSTGMDIDVRTFEPHFTLGRVSKHTPGRSGQDCSAAGVRQFIREREGFAGPMFRVESFILYKSELSPTGAVHTPLKQVSLAGGAE